MDISSIEGYIQNSDKSIKGQIIKKIKKVKGKPFILEFRKLFLT